uniref:Protein NRT1/ PTR FAMILY 4.6 n=1 Tax=Kalanchoe fedtschenkoi TaxID=63787 RepID=A0A7N0TWP4_KALFE
MEVENQVSGAWEGYVDWRGRPAMRGRHGGMLAASFALVVEVLENLAFLANASNLVIYLMEFMHLSLSKSATTVTNFMGTAFLLALLGGFLSDAFFTTFHIYLISALVEFLGLVILTIQARSASLKPPACDPATASAACQELSGGKAVMFYVGLYLVALGVGGIKGSLPPHGAEQFDQTMAKGRKQKSTFFNYFVFSLAGGALIAVTFVVWVEDNLGWVWGFGISTLAIFSSIPIFLAGSRFYKNKIPSGSPLTTIAKVIVAALVNPCIAQGPSNAIASMAISPSASGVPEIKHEAGASEEGEKASESLKCLDRAVQGRPSWPGLKCTIQQVEDVKVVLKILPIFGCTIMLNCCLAQLSTFSVQQADTMDTRVGSFKVPAASLPVFPVVFIMVLAPVYDHLIIPFARKLTKTESGIAHLQRIGFGLILSIVAMAAAALVERKRMGVVARHNMSSSVPDGAHRALPITFFWIAFQYLFLGSADLFTLAGLMEFFFSEAPANMRSLATSLSFASLAVGYFLSSAIVTVVNHVTGRAGHRPWLSGSSPNQYRLERFYWLLCALSGLNFFHFLLWAKLYKYRSAR